MNKTFTSRQHMRYIFLVLSFCCINFFAAGQTFHYVKGTLDITLRGFNPCGSPAPDNGYLEIEVNAANGGSALLIFLDGPGGLSDNNVVIGIGPSNKYTFNPAKNLPDGTYNFIIRDQAATNTINTFVEFATYPPLVLTDLTSVTLSQDILTNNTVCTNPTTGQIQSSISGGSKALPGGGSYSYSWSSNNGLPGLPSGTVNGTTPLNLAAQMGVPGLPGGTYTLTVIDQFGVCGTVQRSFTITDPSPVVQTVTTPTPLDICAGDNITITMNNSESGVTYTILRNGVSTGNSFAGSGSGPFVMTFPSAGFVDNDIIQVRATNGFCSPSTMTNSVVLNVTPLPTPTITSGPNDVCVNTTGNVYTTQAGMTNYTWVVTGGTVTAGGGVNDNTVTVTWTVAGAQSVSINYTQNGCPAAAPTVYPVNVKPLPVPTVASGPNDVCINSTGNVYTTQAGMSNYLWVVTGGTVTAGGGVNDNTVTVTWTTVGAQSVSINYTQNGCTAAAPGVFAVNVDPLPTPTITSGPNDVCNNSTGNVYTTQAGMTNYTWVVTGGTVTAGGTVTDNTVTVTWNTVGAQSVSINYSQSGCAAAAPTVYPVNVKPLPVPTVTSGPNDVCINSTGNVYTTQAGMTNYTWVVTGGTVTAGGGVNDNTVTVTWTVAGAQSVSVNYELNGCTAATPFVYAVNVDPLPVPTITSGPNDVCINSTGNVYTTQAGMSNYLWVVTGGTITAGGGVNDNTATITWTSAGAQSVSINYTQSGCTAVAPFLYAVNVKPLPTPTITSGPNDVCNNSTGNLYTTQAGMSNYTWVVTGGTVTAGGTATDNTVTVTWNTVGAQSVSINYTQTGCTAAAPFVYAVNVKALPTPTVASGPNNVCINSTGNVYTTQAGMSNYTWVVTGGTVTAGGSATDNTVTVTWTASGAQSVSINYTNNGCAAAAPTVYPVNVNPLPVPTITSGPNDVCVNSTGNVYTTQAGMTNYVWVVTGGTVSAGGTATDNTVTITWNTVGAQSVSVNYSQSGCTAVAPFVYAVNVKALPTPTITSGPNDVCNNSTGNVYTTQAGMSNYVWVVTGGTVTAGGTATDNTVTVTWNTVGAQSVSINYTQTGCAAAAPFVYAVNVKALPTPTVASGPNNVCINSTGNVYTTQAGMSAYTWVVTGGTVTAGGSATDNTVTVTWTTAGAQSVSINYTDNGCTAAAPSLYAVNVNPLPVPTITSGPTDVCVNTPLNVYTTQAGMTNYVWVVTGGTVTAGGTATDNTITITWTSAGSQSVSVSYTQNGCTAAAPGSLAVNVNTQPTISGTAIAPICLGATQASLTYTSVSAGTDQYIIDYNGAAQGQGFVDVLNAPLTASPIILTVPPTATAGTWNGNLFVRNSVTGCLSGPTPITITINAGPTATISGTTSICAGSTTNLTVNFTGTGPWTFTYSDGTTTSAPIPSVFSTFVVLAAPSTTTTYTLVSVSDASVTACPGTVSGSAVVTVNQAPQTNLTVGKTIDPLCGGGISDVTVAGSQLGVSYQLRNDAGDVPIGSPVVGTGGTINLSTGTLTTTTTFNVLATVTGCTPAELASTVTITVGGSINAGLAVTAAANPLCSGNSTNIQVANSENGVLYQLRNDANDANIGAAVAGTGGTINLPTGNLAATTSFNVLASNGTCSIELTDIETVNVSPSPNAGLTVAVTLTPLCVGGSTTITVALSENGISYQLRNDAGDVAVGAPIVGTGGTISFPTGALAATTTFNVLATGAGCPPVELTTLATVTVAGNVDATLSVVAAASPICQGSGTDIQVASSENGVTYQLRDDATDTPIGAPVAGNGGTILLPTGNLAATTTFNVLASNGTCSIELVDLETVNVDVAPNPALSVNVSLDPLCVGGISSVTVALSQVGVSYQLRNDVGDVNVGAAVPGNGGTISLSTGVLNATTVFNVLATSGVCPPVELTTLATVNVAGSLNAGLTVTSSASPICSGTSTFIQVQASENGVNYQLRNDLDDSNIGAPVVGTGGTINLPTGNLTINTTFNVVASNGTCSIELTDTEAVTITPGPATNLAVNAATTLICSGASTNIVITASESGVSYQLRNNAGNVLVGSAVVGTGGNIILPTGVLSATTTFNVLATVGTCSAQLTATPTVTIRPVGDPACGGGGTDCANFNAIIPTIVTQPSCNDRDAGIVSFTISRFDGTPSVFRVIWTIGSTTQTKFTSNTVSFNDLSSGAYQYTIIDEGNGKTCGPVDFFLDLKTQVEILDKQVIANVTCYGGTDGNAILTVDGTTTGEYWYKYVLNGVESSAQTFTPGAPLPGGLPADDNNFIIIKVDETFNFLCPDTVMVRIRHTFPKIDYTVASTDVTTCNGTDGSILVSAISGGDSGTKPLQVRLKKAVPFIVDPSGYVVLIDFEDVVNGVKEYKDLSQGNYVVDVQDDLGCVQSKPIAVQAPGQVPLSSVTVTPGDATCVNEGVSGFITVAISDAGLFKLAVSQDQLNVPADNQFVDYPSPGLPSITFNNLVRGAYYVYIKSSTTTCPTRTDAIAVGGVQAVGGFDVLSNCENPNLTVNNITGQVDAPFVIRVFDNDDKFFKIDSLTSSSIPLSRSVTFAYVPPLQHSFLAMPGSYRFVMVQTQTFGTSTCTLVSDTVVYDVRLGLNITLGEVKPSFPEPKRTGSIEIADIDGGTRFVSGSNELYYEVALYDADDDIVIEDFTPVKLNPQNKFRKLYEYLPPGVYRIKVRDASGCEKTIDAEITLDPSVFIPNIFSPNDDNVNDTFEVLNLPVTGTHKLIISNRWGEEVFKSGDYRDGNFWTANGSADGIYFYRLQVDGGEVYSGWVEVIRGSKP